MCIIETPVKLSVSQNPVGFGKALLVSGQVYQIGLIPRAETVIDVHHGNSRRTGPEHPQKSRKPSKKRMKQQESIQKILFFEAFVPMF
jgi:hypothetical protein